MDNIKANVDRLGELSDEEISSLESDMVNQFDEFHAADRSAESVNAMTELADMLETVRGEVVRRKAESDERETAVTELSARVHGSKDDEDSPEEDVVEDAEDEKDDEEETPVTASAETEDEVTTETEASVEEPAVEEVVAETETASEASVEEVEAPAEIAAEETTVEAEASTEEVEVEDETPVETAPEFAAEEVETVVETPAEAEASNIETTIEEIPQEEAQTVTASAEETFEAPADRRPAAQVVESPVAIVAGADLPVPAGSSVSDMKGAAKLFADKLQTLKRVGGGDGGQSTIFSIRTDYAEDRVLDNEALDNDDKINAATPIVAAGGFGTPTPQQYEIFKFDHTSNRPVKDLLPKFGAPRGTISYIEPPVLGDYATSTYGQASGIWTADMDEAAANNSGASDDVIKNVMVLQGAQVRTAELYAVTLQLQVGNFLARAYPELVERHNDLALVQHARLAEKTLIQKIDQGSTQVTQAQVLGVARDFITTVRRAAVAYRSRHRLAKNTVLDAIIPDWVYDAVASDLAMQMPGDDKLSVGRSEIDGYLRDAGVRLTGSPDIQEFTAQGTGPLAPWKTSFEWYLFSPGTWGFLDGGQLDLGVIRDSGLVGTNDYRMFVESFEGIAKFGIESLAITSTIKVDGTASALKVVA